MTCVLGGIGGVVVFVVVVVVVVEKCVGGVLVIGDFREEG
jgi:hypothetical protein